MYTETQLTTIGGKVWKKDKQHRVYFNPPLTAKIYGVLFVTRDMCHVESAIVDGTPVSMDEANTILKALNSGRVWYDFKNDDFRFSGNERIFSRIIAGIKSLADAMPSNVTSDERPAKTQSDTPTIVYEEMEK